MKTTLALIRSHDPCVSGWQKLLKHLHKTAPDDEPLSITTILDSNGLHDALWALRAVEGRDREIRLYVVWCARQVEHLLTDQRSRDALDVAERFARGRASEEELAAASDAASDAAWAASAASAAARAAAWAASAAARAAAWAASAAAWAASAAAWAAAWAASDASGAARAASAAARSVQSAELRRVCTEIDAGRDPYPEQEC